MAERLKIEHETRYAYAPDAVAIAMRMMLWPADFDGQRTSEWVVEVDGEPIEPLFTDGQGRRVGQVMRRGGVAEITVVARGILDVEDRAGVLSGMQEQWPPRVYLRETEFTKADDSLRALGAEVFDGADGDLAGAHALMAAVRERVTYKSGSTSSATRAAEALEAGEGVCQDLSHIMVAAAKAAGRPARYVVGYLFDEGDGDRPAATHAWAEIWIDGLGWVGFDAVNDTCPTDQYVRLCAGCDAFEAAPVRGHVVGDAAEALETSVAVSHVEGQVQQ